MEKDNMNFNILIISGGDVDYEWAAKWLKSRKYAYVIAADRGLMHAAKLDISVDYILGDYDSVDKTVLERYRKNTKVVTYPPEKDYTDTHLAILHAIDKIKEQISECNLDSKKAKIEILGATGNRYDHAITNICNMRAALDENIPCYIYDAYNKIYLSKVSFSINKSEQYGNFLSFVPLSEVAVVTLIGVKYPLKNYELKQGLSVCQSNEIIEEKAYISIDQGTLITFETLEK